MLRGVLIFGGAPDAHRGPVFSGGSVFYVDPDGQRALD